LISLWPEDELLPPYLVAVTNRQRLQMPMTEWAKCVLDGGADLIQLREKDLSLDELRSIAIELLAVLDSPSHLQINGLPELAVELGCGLHLPETMDVIEEPPRPFSRSVHSAQSVSTSISPDFLIAGHLFSTPSKAGLPAQGLSWLHSVVQSAPVPVVAIGGIDVSNAASAIRAGAAGVAVISALTDVVDPGRYARDLRNVIDVEWMQR
jgi:thiazole tautomerase (transcriptional regulator TenI)